jgi:hypothetical protein
MRLARSPLLHFSILGSLLYLLFPAATPEPDRVIRIDSSDIELLQQDWQRRSGRSPDEDELERLIEQFVEEELLVRVARDLGWDRDDSVVRQRLIRNWRFLAPESNESDAAVLRKAYAVGMDRSDIVVRRRLIERVNLMLASRVREQQPDDPELQAYLERNREDFMRPARIRMTQVYLSRDRRGADLHRDAESLSAELRGANLRPEGAVRRGDPFLIQSALPLWSQRQIAERLGGEFAESVMALPLNEWSTPIRSSYGEHVVWLHEREPAALPALSEIRRFVENALYREREAKLLRETVAELRKQFTVEISSPEV